MGPRLAKNWSAAGTGGLVTLAVYQIASQTDPMQQSERRSKQVKTALSFDPFRFPSPLAAYVPHFSGGDCALLSCRSYPNHTEPNHDIESRHTGQHWSHPGPDGMGCHWPTVSNRRAAHRL